MKNSLQIGSLCLWVVLIGALLGAYDRVLAAGADDEAKSEAPALTIYNQQFAVVRQKMPLDSKLGVNHGRNIRELAPNECR
jgi:hypothetical protein